MQTREQLSRDSVCVPHESGRISDVDRYGEHAVAVNQPNTPGSFHDGDSWGYDIHDHLSEDALDGETELAEVQVRKCLSVESQSIVAAYLRGLAAGIEPNSEQTSVEN